METITQTTTKPRRPRVATGVLITSTNQKRRNTINFFDSMNVKIITYFNPINYNNKGFKLINI